MTAISVNILQDNLVGSKELTNIVVRRSRRLTKSKANILSTADKAGFPERQFYFGSLGFFAETSRESQPLVVLYHIYQICSQMRRSTSLKATAQGASTSTANARNSVSVATKPTIPLSHPLMRLTKKTSSKFGRSNNMRIFVQPNRSRLTESGQILFACDTKASFLKQFYFGSLGRFGDFQGRLASLCPFLNVNCFSFSNAKP